MCFLWLRPVCNSCVSFEWQDYAMGIERKICIRWLCMYICCIFSSSNLTWRYVFISVYFCVWKELFEFAVWISVVFSWLSLWYQNFSYHGKELLFSFKSRLYCSNIVCNSKGYSYTDSTLHPPESCEIADPLITKIKKTLVTSSINVTSQMIKRSFGA